MDSQIIIFIVSCLLAGIFSGLSSGLLGLGGGLVIVPVLNYLLPSIFPIDPKYLLPICIQTSFGVIIFNTITASLKQYKLGNINFKAATIIVPPMVIFSIIVGLFVTKINPGYLKIFFGLVVIYSSLNMLRKKSAGEEDPNAQLPPVKGFIAGAAIGGISSTAGISGGSFLGPLFHACKFPIKRALGTSSFCGVFLAISGFFTYFFSGLHVDTGVPYTIGYFSLIAFAAILIPSVIFAHQGVKLQSILPAAKVKRIFAYFLILVAIDMLYDGYLLISEVHLG
ncbi:hypothetical protein CJP74_03150 [Psittacicella melopsittaci]|uniref:Probable membrane transporter protein n=1 Tax=Psittacicella melopsittaci TaxID=2028576 RepID=A0A3A1Y3T9_9GAMM|nr:sulfite exporter TauE/SafE family protein [Psittacicella melopsittaci]RIY32992.1 hypothetical protein CJP74_03150 [Psittacicella melopsittaci]